MSLSGAIDMSGRAVLAVALLLVLWAQGATADAADGLAVTADLIDQYYCGSSPEALSLQLKLRLYFRNPTEEAMVVARPLEFVVSVAANQAAGDRSEFEMSRGPSGPPKKRRLGSRPLPAEFLVVQPTSSAVVEVEATVGVSRRSDKIRRTPVVEGTDHVVRLTLLWSDPFYGMSDKDFARLEEKWRPSGRIVRGVGQTSWVPFSITEIPPTLGECPR
jgi:hypothetical protein